MLREQQHERGREDGRAQHYMLHELSGSVAATRTLPTTTRTDADADNDDDDDDGDDDGEVNDAPACLALPLRLQLQSVRKPEAVRRFSFGAARCVTFERLSRCDNKKPLGRKKLRQ